MARHYIYIYFHIIYIYNCVCVSVDYDECKQRESVTKQKEGKKWIVHRHSEKGRQTERKRHRNIKGIQILKKETEIKRRFSRKSIILSRKKLSRCFPRVRKDLLELKLKRWLFFFILYFKKSMLTKRGNHPSA